MEYEERSGSSVTGCGHYSYTGEKTRGRAGNDGRRKGVEIMGEREMNCGESEK